MFDYVQWFADHGNTRFSAPIARLKEQLAGVNPGSLAAIILEKEIEEIRQSAEDKYDDLKTDPLD
jgi:hypothetical protein